MRSAALLPTPGNPFQLAYWLRNYNLVWRGEVDYLVVLTTRPLDEEVRSHLRGGVHLLGGSLLEHRTGEHGEALEVLVRICDADVVVLCEDDAFVRRSGAVAERVAEVARGDADVVSSPRGGMSPDLFAAGVERWDCGPADDGSTGPGMWPAFVFARREALLATDLRLGPRAWDPGEVVAGLDLRVEGERLVTDTFGGAAFQLRERFRVRNAPQYHGCPGWSRWLDAGVDPPWFHVGSLSSCGDLLAPEGELVLAQDATLTAEAEIDEWALRVSWWRRFALSSARGILERQRERHLANLEVLMSRMGIPEERVERWNDEIERMVTWTN